MKRKTSNALYFVFCMLLIFSEPIAATPALRIAYYLFVIGNLINLVRILRHEPAADRN